ncbi:MAG: hypothetical protein JWO36_2187 [Myxococcales bacterium]|nr:hypothetical protein [Myxococcales bacterium]
MVVTTPMVGWWGYAEANPTLVGIVVVVVVIAAIAYVVRKFVKR